MLRAESDEVENRWVVVALDVGSEELAACVKSWRCQTLMFEVHRVVHRYVFGKYRSKVRLKQGGCSRRK